MNARGLLAPLAIAAAALAIRAVQGDLVGAHGRLKETSDTYGLPPPEETVRMSLGYRAALADVIWAHVLVSQGFHTQARRRFENLTRLLDTINELDPQFREPYLLTDALITFQAADTPHDEVLKAREILERGVKNRPLDAGLWLNLGQFVSFVAPSTFLTDPKEKDEWRRAGVPMLERAAELSGNDANIAWQALGGAGILRRAGERDAAIRFLQRTLMVTDDDELKAKIQTQLDALLGEQQAEVFKKQEATFQRLWRSDLPFVDRGTILELGPPREPARCAGGGHDDDPACATTWRQWSERMSAAGQ